MCWLTVVTYIRVGRPPHVCVNFLFVFWPQINISFSILPFASMKISLFPIHHHNHDLSPPLEWFNIFILIFWQFSSEMLNQIETAVLFKNTPMYIEKLSKIKVKMRRIYTIYLYCRVDAYVRMFWKKNILQTFFTDWMYLLKILQLHLIKKLKKKCFYVNIKIFLELLSFFVKKKQINTYHDGIGVSLFQLSSTFDLLIGTCNFTPIPKDL